MTQWLSRLLFLTGCALILGALFCLSAGAEPVRVWLATDIHHLSPELTDYGSLFTRAMEAGDGKLTEHSGELTEVFLERAVEVKADAVVITGDLTFNGELSNLKDLIERLKACEDRGVPVLVIPGNHDISYRQARSYFGDQSTRVDNISQADFEALCAFLGPDLALAKDEASFSYICPLGDVWLLMLDANTDRARIGALPEETLQWLEEWLKKAREEGKTVLSFTHQNLLPVNLLFANDFTVTNCKKVLALYREYGVQFNFSGHSHIQHKTVMDGLTEYVTGPLCVTPLHYAVITADKGNVAYESRTMDMYQQEAAERFRKPTQTGMQSLPDTFGVTEEEAAAMTEFAATLNQAYFAGDQETIDALRSDPAWALWIEHATGSFWHAYMQSIFEGF